MQQDASGPMPVSTNTAPQLDTSPQATHPAEFGGHPSQAHADHAAIMHAHGITQHPERMAAVHALHAQAGQHMGASDFYKGKMKKLMGEKQPSPPGEAASTDAAADGGKSFTGTEQ